MLQAADRADRRSETEAGARRIAVLVPCYNEEAAIARVVADPMPSTPAAPANGCMVIEIGRDRRVIVDAGVDAAALARVLAILERR